MPTFICQGRYTSDEWEGLLAAPEKRVDAVPQLAQRLGAKVVSYYITTGEDDFHLIVEAPDSLVAATLAAAVQGDRSTLRISEASCPTMALTNLSRSLRIIEELPKSL